MSVPHFYLPAVSGVSGLYRGGYSNDRAIEFNGTTQWLSATNVSIGVGAPASGTLAFWVDLTDIVADPNQVMFSLNEGATGTFTVYFSSVNNRTYISGEIGVTSFLLYNAAVDLSASGFYHVAITSSGAAWTLYVDGTARTLTVEDGLNSGVWFDDVNPNGDSELTIGASAGGADLFVDGIIDEMGIWNSALTQANINSLYNAGAGVLYGVARDIGDRKS